MTASLLTPTATRPTATVTWIDGNSVRTKMLDVHGAIRLRNELKAKGVRSVRIDY
jgi:hypothetical protein